MLLGALLLEQGFDEVRADKSASPGYEDTPA